MKINNTNYYSRNHISWNAVTASIIAMKNLTTFGVQYIILCIYIADLIVGVMQYTVTEVTCNSA